MTDEWTKPSWAPERFRELTSPIKALTVVEPPTIKAITGPGVAAYANDYPLSSLLNNPQDRSAAYLRAYKMGWFYKAESKISGDLSTLPWTVSDGDVESKDKQEATIGRPDLDIPFEALNPIEQFMRLMEKPNPTRQTGRQLRQKTFIRRDMAGVGFWYLEASSETSPITAIYGISPARLWPARDKQNNLIGYALDVNSPGGATMTFEPWEIVNFSNASADDGDGDIFGVGVVEAVYAELPLTDFLTRHTADLLSTGGRLSGMMWPKERALNEDEFTDAQRAWRNVISDPASAKRLLLFPEPMEWQAGAATPKDIGIPELAALNRDNILTAFPIGPEMLGVPMPGGLNASGESRRELYDFYQRETLQPRSVSFDEIVQTNIVSRYEALMGQTFRFETELPNLDDASSLLEKAGAWRALFNIGFDPRDSIKAVGLDHIKWNGVPDTLDPAKQAELQAQAQVARQQQPQLTASVSDTSRQDNSQVSQSVVGKATKSRETIADSSVGRLATFLADQRERLSERIRETYPQAKAWKGMTKPARMEAIKADPWFDKAEEDALLRAALFGLYFDASRGSLQVVADLLDRIVPNKAVQRVIDDITAYGGERISDINARTLEAIVLELAEGTRRGYSIPQLIDGVPDEGFLGVKGVSLDNGTPVFGDARAETIARTETALSYNRAALDAYKEFNVSKVLAYDGDFDEECAQRNGQEFTIEEALTIEDHPNGTLDWAPVVDKAWHGDPMEALKAVLIEAVKSVTPTTINNFVEPAKAADMHMDAPVVNVTPDIHVTTPDINVEPAQVTVNVPEQPAPVVNITTPDVNVAPPNLTVNVPEQPAPIVNVKVPERHITVEAPPPAEVTVNVPAQKTPHVTVEAPPPAEVNVTVNTPEPKRTRKVLRHEKDGTTTVTEEPDGR